jgi:Glycosyl hydrolase family 71
MRRTPDPPLQQPDSMPALASPTTIVKSGIRAQIQISADQSAQRGSEAWNRMGTMRRLLTLRTLIALLMVAVGAAPDAAGSEPATPTEAFPRRVFAHYMVAFPTYGEEVNDYKREIKEAQALGIDGFVLDVAAWSEEPYWRKRTANMFKAALQLNTGFKLFFSADMCCELPSADIQEMMKAFSSHPSYLRHEGRPVLTTFQGQALGPRFWEKALGFRRKLNILFVPGFSTSYGRNWEDPANGVFANPTYAEIEAD